MSFEVTINASNIQRQEVRDWVESENLSYVAHIGHQVVNRSGCLDTVRIDMMVTYAFRLEEDAFRFAMRWA